MPPGKDFYPRPPRGGRPGAELPARPAGSISIHALREEGDCVVSQMRTRSDSISIHALREEGDSVTAWLLPLAINFYPRPPRGGRLRVVLYNVQTLRFLSTPSARRATAIVLSCASFLPYFYPRPPRGGRLPTLTRTTPPLSHFYPRPPRGGRLARRYIPSLIA